MDTEIKSNLVDSYNLNAKLRDKTEIDEWKIEEMDYFYPISKTLKG